MKRNHNMDMTQGNALKLIVLFSLPIFLGNLFQQMYSLVDTMVAGYNLGDQAIAAIGAVTALDTLIIQLAIGLNAGFAIILTMAIGSHDTEKTRRSIATMIRFNLNAAVVLTIVSCALLNPILKLLKTPQDIFQQSYRYTMIICAGLVTNIAYNMFSSILRSFGNSLMSLVFLIFSSILNIVLDILFVAGFHMGLEGAAIATVISAAISALLSGIYFIHNYKEYIPTRKDFAKDREISRSMVSSGFGMTMMYTSVNLGTMIFQGAINSLGALYITAHTASRKLMLMFMMPGSSLSAAMATYVSQNWGARKKDRIRKGIQIMHVVSQLVGLLIILIAFVFGPLLVRTITGSNDQGMIDLAILSIRLQVVFFPPLMVLLVTRQMLQATGNAAVPVIAAILELTCKILATALVVPTYGFVAVCLTEPVSWVVCAVYIFVSYLCKRKSLFQEQTA